MGVLSIAFSRPRPYVLHKEANGVIAAAIAVLVINDLLELDINVVLIMINISVLNCCELVISIANGNYSTMFCLSNNSVWFLWEQAIH